MTIHSIEDDDEDEEIEYGDVNFNPSIILAVEQVYAEEIATRIKDKKWAQTYFDNDGQRKFTITFALGLQLEFRVAIGTTINIIIRSINLLPGGQESLTSPGLA